MLFSLATTIDEDKAREWRQCRPEYPELRIPLAETKTSFAKFTRERAHQLRRGTPPVWGGRAGDERERELALQAELAYQRLVSDWQHSRPKQGAGATPGRASSRPSERQAAERERRPDPCAETLGRSFSMSGWEGYAPRYEFRDDLGADRHGDLLGTS